MSYPGPELDKSVRDRTPDLIGSPEHFNQGFFTDIAPLLAEELGTEKLLVNSGAVVRWEIVKLMMGERAEKVESELINKDLVELSWEEFESLYGDLDASREQKLVLYSTLAAVSKLVIRDYKKDVMSETASATDTVNYARDEQGEWIKMEKPKSYDEACAQIDLLIDGGEFFVANASVVGKVGNTGIFGTSMWMLPLRYSFGEAGVKEEVRTSLKRKLETVFENDEWQEVRPGGVSGVDEIWLPYLQIGSFASADEHEILGLIEQSDFSFVNYLTHVKSWDNLESDRFTDHAKVAMGATIIGGPVYGIRKAVLRYVAAIKLGSQPTILYNSLREKVLEMSGGNKLKV